MSEGADIVPSARLQHKAAKLGLKIPEIFQIFRAWSRDVGVADPARTPATFTNCDWAQCGDVISPPVLGASSKEKPCSEFLTDDWASHPSLIEKPATLLRKSIPTTWILSDLNDYSVLLQTVTNSLSAFWLADWCDYAKDAELCCILYIIVFWFHINIMSQSHSIRPSACPVLAKTLSQKWLNRISAKWAQNVHLDSGWAQMDV